MALSSSGSISLSQIQTEYGGSNPIALNAVSIDSSDETSHSISNSAPNSSAIGLIFFKNLSFWYKNNSSAPWAAIDLAIPLAIENLFANPVIIIFLLLSIFWFVKFNYKPIKHLFTFFSINASISVYMWHFCYFF